jgi:hypothetical protein
MRVGRDLARVVTTGESDAMEFGSKQKPARWGKVVQRPRLSAFVKES